jgi:hypothetical protein
MKQFDRRVWPQSIRHPDVPDMAQSLQELERPVHRNRTLQTRPVIWFGSPAPRVLST